MAESSSQQTTEKARTRPSLPARLAGWIAGQYASLSLTALLAAGGGAGGALLIANNDLGEFTQMVEDVQEDVQKVANRIDKLESNQQVLAGDWIAAHDESMAKLRGIERVLRGTAVDLGAWSYHTELTHELHEQQMTSIKDATINSYNGLVKELRQHSRKIDDVQKVVLEGQVEAVKTLSGQIKALSEQLDSARHALIDQLKRLVTDGKKAIDGKDLAEIRRWIEKANYMVRSLAIPTEAGFLKDTSVVKEDLRQAMEGFAKEKDRGDKMAHAKRVLVIVEAVCELAAGGRIP